MALDVAENRGTAIVRGRIPADGDGDLRTTLRSAAREWYRSGAALARRATSPLRLLPDFVIIGAQRSGSSSLYHYLEQHPCVGPAARKEVHFFDLNWEKGLGWYRAYFPIAARRAFHRWRHDPTYVTGEACPYYLFHPHVPERLVRVAPDAKLIAILRNPADRAISHYLHERKKGREPLSFDESIRREEERLGTEAGTLHVGEDYEESAHRRFSYLARGRYAEQLERWQHRFPPGQILVVAAEDMFRDAGAVYRQVLHFFGLPPWDPPAFPRFNQGPRATVEWQLRGTLIDYFRPHNERLYELLGRDLGWDRT